MLGTNLGQRIRPLRLAINGFGRIGRNVLRALIERFEVLGCHIQLVAINDIADAQTLLHLLKYDSTYGRLSQLGVTARLRHSSQGDRLLCLSKANKSYCIRLLNIADPEQLPWQLPDGSGQGGNRGLDVDVVLECTGHFRSYADASRHRQAGAKQVIIGAAPFDEVDACVVMGVNDHLLSSNLPIISGVSCTTQALVPLLDTLQSQFGIRSAMMTEIHAVTADQTVLDQAHRDLRRARASGHNIIPTTSSSIAATERVLPYMQGRVNGHSIRVPTIDVAAIDVTLLLETPADTEQVAACLYAASLGRLKGIMGYTEEPLVSSDFIHQPESLIVDAQQLLQVGEQIKVFAWYDNEWGYANRLLDMCLQLSVAYRQAKIEK